MYPSLRLVTFRKCYKIIFELNARFFLLSRIMVRLWHCAVLVLLLAEATQATRTGYLFENLQQLPH